VAEGAKGTFLRNFSDDGNVITTYDGEVIEAKVTRESLTKLAAVRDALYACFQAGRKGADGQASLPSRNREG
jgi:hypothetical protein